MPFDDGADAVDDEQVFGRDRSFVGSARSHEQPERVARYEPAEVAARSWRPSLAMSPLDEPGQFLAKLLMHL